MFLFLIELSGLLYGANLKFNRATFEVMFCRPRCKNVNSMVDNTVELLSMEHDPYLLFYINY